MVVEEVCMKEEMPRGIGVCGGDVRESLRRRRLIRAPALKIFVCFELTSTEQNPYRYARQSLLLQPRYGEHPDALVRPTRIHRRGAKSSTRVKLNDLPQGIIPAEPLEPLQDEPAYPTVVQQARRNMRAFEHCVLLTRVGNFYELYLEQAEEYGPLLNLKVAQKKTTAGPVSMAGFPFFQLDRFLKLLVQDLHKHVAISEEFANPVSEKIKSGGLLFDRRITRVITPGTLIDERFLDPLENNFLLAVHLGDPSDSLPTSQARTELKVDSHVKKSKHAGLAWLDLSTGDFFTQSIRLPSLVSSVARIGPREILLEDLPSETPGSSLSSTLNEFRPLITFVPPREAGSQLGSSTALTEDLMAESDHKDFTPEEISASSILLQYANSQLLGQQLKLQPPVRRQLPESMLIDKHSMRALEIKTTLREGFFKGSLLHAVRRTVTSSGSRRLNDWLTSPSMSLPVINGRLDLAEYILGDPELREPLVGLLRKTSDSKRIIQRFSLGRGDSDDLIALCKTIQITHEISTRLDAHQHALRGHENSVRQPTEQSCIDTLLGRLRLDGPLQLAERIASAIDEEGVNQLHRFEEAETAAVVSLAQIVESEAAGEDEEGVETKTRSRKAKKTEAIKPLDPDFQDVWVMKKDASELLEQLHSELDGLREQKQLLETELRERLNVTSLTLRWTPGLGHICHVKGRDAKQTSSALDHVRTVSSRKTTRSFHLPEWTSLGGKIDQMKLRIRAEEQQVFLSLREESVLHLVKLRENAAIMDELDIACSSAKLAQERQLVRPILNHGLAHKIVGGRHPMVEGGLEEQGRTFTTNDCFVGDQGRIWFITGPNMAGKSTFLRQNVLLSIMAQAGLFVPADYAELGIVDQIFSRVGSADNLYENQSTFMVEMLESAAILKEATSRSFVIMDEIGRGTTPEDGIALAYACLHHLYHTNRCRALFATHFHVLADMAQAGGMEQVTCLCTDVAQAPDGSFSYVHRLRRGVNRQSHALKVARLAGE
ncbi:MAG: DNA mismatch repair ATPase msh1 [Watsoniomyces obsoletus]|nr:MAG: DNA mismatch repair ATPase msh1 [Watsoniomyces obsoletus]